MGLFDHMNLFADIATNHRGDKGIFANLFLEIQQAGAIPKIQLYSEEIFPRKWVNILPPEGFIPSVFQPADVDFILPYKPLALKVASVESTYWELIERCMQEKDLPLIVSTGGMDESEILDLIDMIHIDQELCLMHCVSLYPTPKEQINLGRLAKMSEDFDGTSIVLGWSSHYPVVDESAFALAWAWGATQFEVHVRPSFLENQRRAMAAQIYPDILPDMTLDEQCAFTPFSLKQIRAILEDLPILEGEDNYSGPDRDFVVEHRKRWMK